MCAYERNKIRQVLSSRTIMSGTYEEVKFPITVSPVPFRRPSYHVPASHPLKIAWDILTIILSLTVGLYTTHASMRDQCFPHLLNNNCTALNKGAALPLFFGYFHGSTVVTLYDLWRVADIVLNFLTEDVNEHRNPQIPPRVKLTYLRTWFLIDVITLLSWEVLYVQPVFNRNIKKNVFLKAIGVTRLYLFLRATKRWSMILRVSRRAISMVGHKSSRKLIRYAPKYIHFALTGKMKVIVVLRIARQVRLVRTLYGQESIYGPCRYLVPITDSKAKMAAAAA